MAVTGMPQPVANLPIFITSPGDTDWLLIVVAIFLVAMILMVGNLYFQLHALPERMSHRANKLQLEIVAVLALISLFTHNHLFWIAGLLLAMVTFPDFSTPLNSISESLRRLSGRPPSDDFAAEADVHEHDHESPAVAERQSTTDGRSHEPIA